MVLVKLGLSAALKYNTVQSAFHVLALLVGWQEGDACRKLSDSGGVLVCYLPGARCRSAYGPVMPLPVTVSCFGKIQIGSGTGSPG